MNSKDYYQIKESLQEKNVELVAISKTKPIEAIQEFYNLGQRVFGENRAREMQSKYEALPKDIEWHMVGHMQTNKVKYIAPFVHLIHSIDSLSLLEEVNKRARQNNRNIQVLLQIHIALEQHKFGFDLAEIKAILQSPSFHNLKHIEVMGLMGMATFTDNEQQVRKEFQYMKACFKDIQTSFFPEVDSFNTLSMGMSGDYKIAIEEGANMVRIGSLLFGHRG